MQSKIGLRKSLTSSRIRMELLLGKWAGLFRLSATFFSYWVKLISNNLRKLEILRMVPSNPNTLPSEVQELRNTVIRHRQERIYNNLFEKLSKILGLRWVKKSCKWSVKSKRQP
jgi:hypothetical protein